MILANFVLLKGHISLGPVKPIFWVATKRDISRPVTVTNGSLKTLDTETISSNYSIPKVNGRGADQTSFHNGVNS